MAFPQHNPLKKRGRCGCSLGIRMLTECSFHFIIPQHTKFIKKDILVKVITIGQKVFDINYDVNYYSTAYIYAEYDGI